MVCCVGVGRVKVKLLIDKLIRALRCNHFKGWNESVKSIKIKKKILDVKNMFKYEL